MVILSSLAKKNQNLKFEFEEKKGGKFENDQKNFGCVWSCG